MRLKETEAVGTLLARCNPMWHVDITNCKENLKKRDKKRQDWDSNAKPQAN